MADLHRRENSVSPHPNEEAAGDESVIFSPPTKNVDKYKIAWLAYIILQLVYNSKILSSYHLPKGSLDPQNWLFWGPKQPCVIQVRSPFQEGGSFRSLGYNSLYSTQHPTRKLAIPQTKNIFNLEDHSHGYVVDNHGDRWQVPFHSPITTGPNLWDAQHPKKPQTCWPTRPYVFDRCGASLHVSARPACWPANAVAGLRICGFTT